MIVRTLAAVYFASLLQPVRFFRTKVFKKNFLSFHLVCLNVKLYTVVGDNINTMKTTFNLNFVSYEAFIQHGKHGNKEKLSIKKASLYLLVNLWFEKSLLTIKTLKSRLHYIDIIAYNHSFRQNCLLFNDF